MNSASEEVAAFLTSCPEEQLSPPNSLPACKPIWAEITSCPGDTAVLATKKKNFFLFNCTLFYSIYDLDEQETEWTTEKEEEAGRSSLSWEELGRH
jgi:hypothetical protein